MFVASSGRKRGTILRGSIFKRKHKDGSISYGVIYDDLPGPEKKRRQKRLCGFQTKKDADRKLTEIRSAMHQGRYIEPTKLTVREYGEKWIAEIEHIVRPRTLVGYRQRLHDYALPRIGHMPMWAVQPQHVKDLYEDLLRNGRKRKQKDSPGLQPRSVVHMHRILHSMFAEAVRSGVVISNPCTSVRPPRVTQKEQRVLTESEVQRLLKAAEGTALHAFMVTSVATGARAGELAALTWPNVDLETGRLTIAFGQARDGSRSEPKTQRSRRTVSLPTFALSVLRAYKAKRKLASGPSWSEEGFVFVDRLERPLLVANISGDFREIADVAGLSHDVHPHTLRHTYASLALKGGVPVTTVSANLGHNNTTTTLNVYAHHIPSAEDTAALAIQRALGGVS